jgi:hypothetical protein
VGRDSQKFTATGKQKRQKIDTGTDTGTGTGSIPKKK